MDRQTDRRQTEDRQLCLGQTGREKTDRAVRLVADKQRNGEKTDRAAVLADRQKDVQKRARTVRGEDCGSVFHLLGPSPLSLSRLLGPSPLSFSRLLR